MMGLLLLGQVIALQEETNLLSALMRSKTKGAKGSDCIKVALTDVWQILSTLLSYSFPHGKRDGKVSPHSSLRGKLGSTCVPSSEM
jgi:hypothetical protein